MKNKIVSLFFLPILFLFTHTLYAQQYIAVSEFKAQGISEDEVSILTDRLRNELFHTSKFKLIEREMMNEILKEQGFQQSSCSSDECIVEMGRLIGVNQIIAGSISKLARLYTVSARIIDVETGEVVHLTSYDCKCELENLLETGMQKVALKLAREDNDQTENNVENEDEEYIDEFHPTKWSVFPFQLAIWQPVQFMHSSTTISGLRICVIYGRNKNIFGGDFGLINKVDQDMAGFQAGLINITKHVWGLQAGFINANENVFLGQIGFINNSKSVNGVQIGFVNITQRLRGVQIGLINTIKYTRGPNFFPIVNISF